MGNEQAVAVRPTAVVVLGWGWGIVGGLMCVSGCLAVAVTSVMNSMAPGGFPPKGGTFPPQFAPMMVIFEYFQILLVLQLLLGGAIVWTAVHFMKLREWARRGLLVFSALGLLYIVSFSIYWMSMWQTLTSGALTQLSDTHAAHPPHPLPPQVVPPEWFSSLGIVMGVFNMITFSLPLILSIRALRGKTVRDAIAAAAQGE